MTVDEAKACMAAELSAGIVVRLELLTKSEAFVALGLNPDLAYQPNIEAAGAAAVDALLLKPTIKQS